MKSRAAAADPAELPALKVLLRARAEGRMPHAVLLTGPDPETLERAALRLASVHLACEDPVAHPDCAVLRPTKKSRRISMEAVQDVVASLRLTAAGPSRAVIVNEPDRFQAEAANAFLKSLEEPPPGTLIVLQTANYYRVLPTVLSRCLRFHIAGEAPQENDPAWGDWLRDFDRLLAKAASSGPVRLTETFIPAYALCARFESLLEKLTEDALERFPVPPGDDDREEAADAHEESLRRAVRARLLSAVEERLRVFGRARPDCAVQTAASVVMLEGARVRLELNYQVLAALEQFMLQMLRTFARRHLATSGPVRG
ncbi:MAG: hypothetical protein ACK467_04515 [Opitutia bacterium]|jgi:DNA polymerase-3 subunit delta'